MEKCCLRRDGTKQILKKTFEEEEEVTDRGRVFVVNWPKLRRLLLPLEKPILANSIGLVNKHCSVHLATVGKASQKNPQLLTLAYVK